VAPPPVGSDGTGSTGVPQGVFFHTRLNNPGLAPAISYPQGTRLSATPLTTPDNPEAPVPSQKPGAFCSGHCLEGRIQHRVQNRNGRQARIQTEMAITASRISVSTLQSGNGHGELVGCCILPGVRPKPHVTPHGAIGNGLAAARGRRFRPSVSATANGPSHETNALGIPAIKTGTSAD